MKRYSEFLLEANREQGQVKTWGGLRAMIKSLITKKRLDAAKSGAVNILVDQVAGLIPGMSNIKSAFDFFKNIYTADDNKKTNTWIDKLNVDDKFSDIVDDSVEDQFIKDLVQLIDKKNPDEDLPTDFNINKMLIDFLARKYDKRTLIFSEKLKNVKLFESFNITSTTNNKVVAYFETGQGSKYLITDKGETKRWKSLHSNTGEEDTGLKDWHQKSFFVDPKFQYEANSILFLIDKGFKCGLNVDKNKTTIYVVDNGKWRIGNMLDAYPKSKIDKPLIFDCTNKLTLGYCAVEYNLNADNFSIKKYHFGSEVSKIIPADKLTEEEIKYFRKS